MGRLIGILTLFACLAACTDQGTPEPGVKVYKPLGSLQCGGGDIVPLAEMEKQLVSAGIAVRSSSCGRDGLIHLPTCGEPDDRINIFEIPQSGVSSAASLGFKLLSTLPNARPTQCD